MAADLVVKKWNNKKELIDEMELGLVGDEEIRELIRNDLEKRLKWGYKSNHEQQLAQLLHFVHSLRGMKIAADEVESFNIKVYEAPFSFNKIQLGSSLKESSCYYKHDETTLDEGEIAMMELYTEKAQIKDGQSVLDLGCGLGSLTLYVANKYPNCKVTGTTASLWHKDFIESKCKEQELTNVKIVLGDATTHEMEERFDRILAIGLIEHLKNYGLLLGRISKWLKDDGFLFIQHVCHKTLAYPLVPVDEEDWISDYIFPGGTLTMPSASLLLYFQDELSVVDHSTLNGKHFSRTHEEWLKNIDAKIDEVKEILKSVTKTEEEVVRLTNFWRIFCMFGAEMFGYNNGEEWMLSQILFKKK